MKRVLIMFLIGIFINIFFNIPNFANAQLQTPIDGVTISSEPVNPAPGQDVTVTIESYLIDLNSASIVWLSDNKNIGSGIGIKEIKVKAPTLGKKAVITAVIKTNNGREIRKAIILKSGSVEIIWESKGYIPPFFKGKNSFIYQNEIKLTAIPHISIDGIKEIDTKSLVYQWKRGGKYIDGANGYGKQSVTIKSENIPKTEEISVDVYTRDQSQSATKSINIEPGEPSISFYENDALYGIYFNKAISNRLSLNNSEVTILATPYGFNYKNNSLSYTWSINNVEQPDLSENQSITLRTKEGTEGSSNINLEIRNIKDILQGARGAFTVSFKNKEINNDESVTF